MATVAVPLALQDAGILTPPFDLLLDGREVDVVLGAATTAVDLDLNMDSTLAVQITVRDQQRKLLRSGVLDSDSNGRLDKSLDIRVGAAWYRVAKCGKAGDTFTLGCEDRSAAILRGARGQLKPRDGEDHVRFARHLCALAGVPFVTPTGVAVTKAGTARQVKAQRDDADKRREKGIAEGANLKVKGKKATAEQIRNIEIILGVAAKEKAGANGASRAIEAMVVAAIGESSIRDVPNAAGSKYTGVFQADRALGLSTAQQARAFLRGGNGFQVGGAIAASKAHPSWSPGEIAYRVEGSRANFGSDAAAERHYQQHIGEATAIISAYHGPLGRSTARDKARVTAALVQRGTPESPQESSLTAISRFGKAKGYRLFFDRNTAVYADEHDLIDSRARAILSEASPGVDWLDGEMDPAKKVNTASLQVLAKLWSLPQGCSIIVRDSGFLNGRWLVSKVAQSRFSVKASIELRRGTELVQPERTTETASSTISLGAGTQSGAAGSSDSLVSICRRFNGRYVYGGGHGGALASLSFNSPMDCSSSCSKALREAGMFSASVAWVSGKFASSYGQPGRGREWSIYANGGHVFIQGEGDNNWRFDTGGPGGGNGPRFHTTRRPTAGFTARHWSGR